MAGLLWYGVVCLRPKLDSSGHPILHSDGRPVFERDWVGEIQTQWPGYSCLALAAFFFVRGIAIRFRPLSSTNANDQSRNA